MLDTRPEMRGFVNDVTARYGSLGEFFAQLRADVEKQDDEVTVELPVVDRRSGPVAWSAADVPDESATTHPGVAPALDREDGMTAHRRGATGIGGKIRNAPAAVWRRLTRRQ